MVQNYENKNIKNYDININKNLNNKIIIDNNVNNLNNDYFASIYDTNKNIDLKLVYDNNNQIIIYYHNKL